MNKCEVCGYLHYRTDPCRAAKKSQVGKPATASRARTEQSGIASDIEEPIPEVMSSNQILERGPAVGYEAHRGGNGQKAGNPPTKFDKAQWMRQNMPTYMKRYRAEVKSGLRVPKPRTDVPS